MKGTKSAAPASSATELVRPTWIVLVVVAYVATIANTAIFLLDLGFDGGSAAVVLTVVVMAVAVVLGVLGVVRRRG